MTSALAPEEPRYSPKAKRPGRYRADDIDRAFGRAVRERRIELGLTQQQVSERVGVTYQQHHKREAGINRFSLGAAVKTARALDMTVDVLLGEPTAPLAASERGHLALHRAARGLDQEQLSILAAVARAMGKRRNGRG